MAFSWPLLDTVELSSSSLQPLKYNEQAQYSLISSKFPVPPLANPFVLWFSEAIEASYWTLNSPWHFQDLSVHPVIWPWFYLPFPRLY
jgi:hypothetical protein